MLKCVFVVVFLRCYIGVAVEVEAPSTPPARGAFGTGFSRLACLYERYGGGMGGPEWFRPL